VDGLLQSSKKKERKKKKMLENKYKHIMNIGLANLKK
jgi:hypothetical protein